MASVGPGRWRCQRLASLGWARGSLPRLWHALTSGTPYPSTSVPLPPPVPGLPCPTLLCPRLLLLLRFRRRLAAAWLSLVRWSAYSSVFLAMLIFAHECCRYHGPDPPDGPDQQVLRAAARIEAGCGAGAGTD